MNTRPFPAPPRIVLAGSVGSSRRILQGLLRNRASVVGVLGLGLEGARNVSGYTRLDDIAATMGIPYADYVQINDPSIVELVRSWQPDLLFAVGLSQLIKPELAAIPAFGCVGFHPTMLPADRGRAPLAWLTLEGRQGAASFFVLDDGVDSGPLLAQEPFAVTADDYASDVAEKMEAAIDRALDRWIPQLQAGHWAPAPQDHSQATYRGRRSPEDGLVDWSQPAEAIYALIRASAEPHPGAYTYFKHEKVIVWRAEVVSDVPFQGVPGRILVADERGWLIQTGDGLLRLLDVTIPSLDEQSVTNRLRVGVRLGYAPQDEVFLLRQRLSKLEQQVVALMAATAHTAHQVES